METLKNLPIGVQTFQRMREGNYIYIDKTEHIYNIAQKEGGYFLSRPRRFGKSLFLSTLKELFEGNRALFKGLWIDDKWDWEQPVRPVIHLSFVRLEYKQFGLLDAILTELKAWSKVFGYPISNEAAFKSTFEGLIKHVHQQHGRIVILIDEYDKPIIDYLEKAKLPQAKENQEIMKEFYAILKDAEPYLYLLFITGVSKFSKVSIFSDLNHLSDLTLNRKYATIAGYTQAELEHSFEGYIQVIAKAHYTTRTSLLAAIKDWYNGFSWDGEQTLYNPFGTLNFFENQEFRNYWFSTGTPSFLVDLMREQVIYRFEQKRVSYLSLEKYDLNNLDLTAIMFQTGYLTIKKRDITNGEVVLDYPNREVRDSMYQFIMDDLSRSQGKNDSNITVKELAQAFRENNLKQVELIINTLFADIPSPLYEQDANNPRRASELSERFFHSIVHLIFKYLGIFIESEISTSWGRADSVVTTTTHIYVFEFKYNRSGKYALDYLLSKNYPDKYRASGKILMGIGVSFSQKTRRINGWKVKEL
jgi:Predicted AAA-ATPase/PD-(D/E)XK nuclease superfamily